MKSNFWVLKSIVELSKLQLLLGKVDSIWSTDYTDYEDYDLNNSENNNIGESLINNDKEIGFVYSNI